MKKYFLLLLVYLLVFCRLFAQQAETDFSYNFIHYGLEEGLPSNETYYFLEDVQGYLWIGTDKGVARFNGYAFKTYTTKDGLTDNTILRMASGPDGKVWMACYNNTLSYFDKGRFYPFEHNEALLKASRELLGPPEIDIDQDERIFYKTTKGALIIDRTGQIQLLQKARSGKMPETHKIITFNHSLKCFSSVSDYRSSICPINIEPSASITLSALHPFKSLNSYFLDAGSYKYLYIHEILFILENNKIVFEKKISEAPLGAMTKIGTDIWISSMNGIIVIDQKGNIKNKFLENRQISAIFQDKNKNVWVATLNEGIYLIKNRAVQTLSRQGNPIKESFPILFNLDQTVLAAGKSIELNCSLMHSGPENFQMFNQSCDFYQSFPIERFYTNADYQFNFDHYFIQLDAHNLIKSFCKKGEKVYAISKNQVLKLSRENNHLFWNNLYYFRDNKSMNSIYLFDNGVSLIGAVDGLYWFTGHSIVEHPKSKAINSRIQDIELLGADTILGTRGNGLKILKQDKILTYTEENGLLSNSVNGLFKSGDTLWIATDAGVNILYLQTDSLVLKKKITLADGLNSKQIRQLILLDSMVYLGTERGLNKVDLRLLDQHKTRTIPVYFTNIRINDSDTVVLNSYHLKHNQKLIRITFEAIDFKQSGDILYRYRMIGLSDRWDFTTDRNVLYSNLSPGTYVFELAAQYTNGSWTDSKQVEFIISEPYWETWWFQISMFLIFSGLGYGIYASSSAARRKREQLSKELNTSKQMALGSQINPHFIFNSLNSIYNFLLKNKGETAQVYLVRFSRLIRNVFENSLENYISLAQEIETLKIYFDLEQLRFSNKFTYQFQIGEDIPQEDTFLPPMLLQPLAENAIWHGLLNKETQESSFLQIKIEKTGDMLQFEVKDNGIGITRSKEQQKNQLLRKTKSTGLSITKKRVFLVNEFYNKESRFTIEDLVEDHQIRGTIVAFSLPYISSKP